MTEITVGFDGSRQRHQGTTDATAIVCATLDGHVFVPCGGQTIWQAPPGPAGYGWEVPVGEVDAAMRDVLGTYEVVGCYCDPNKWEGFVSGWEGTFGHRVRVRASRATSVHVLADRTPVHQRGRSVPPSRHRRRAHPRRQPAPHRPRPERTAATQHLRRHDREGVSFLGPKGGWRRRAVLAWQARLDALARPGPSPPDVCPVPRAVRSQKVNTRVFTPHTQTTPKGGDRDPDSRHGRPVSEPSQLICTCAGAR